MNSVGQVFSDLNALDNAFRRCLFNSKHSRFPCSEKNNPVCLKHSYNGGLSSFAEKVYNNVIYLYSLCFGAIVCDFVELYTRLPNHSFSDKRIANSFSCFMSKLNQIKQKGIKLSIFLWFVLRRGKDV